LDYTESVAFATPWFSVIARKVDSAAEPFYSLRLDDYVTVVAVTRQDRVVLVRGSTGPLWPSSHWNSPEGMLTRMKRQRRLQAASCARKPAFEQRVSNC
jgi:hypothetical protein